MKIHAKKNPFPILKETRISSSIETRMSSCPFELLNDISPKKSILLLGDPKSGKSCYLRHYTHGSYRSSYIPSLKIETVPLVFVSSNRNVVFDVKDVPGSFTDLKIRDHIDGAIIFLDLTSKDRHLLTWYRMVLSMSIPIVLCGNKDDCFLKRDDDDIVAFAEAKRIPYFRTSALTMYNFIKPFESLGKEIYGSDFKLCNVPLITSEEYSGQGCSAEEEVVKPYLIPIWPERLFLSSENSLDHTLTTDEPIFALEI